VCQVAFFVVDGAEVVQARVSPEGVGEDLHLQLVTAGPRSLVDQLGLERRERRLSHRVVERRPDATHGCQQSRAVQRLLEWRSVSPARLGRGHCRGGRPLHGRWTSPTSSAAGVVPFNS